MSDKPTDMLRVVKITPSASSDCDYYLIDAKKSWADTLHFIEETLDDQFLKSEDGEIEWDGITATVQCKTMTRQRFRQLRGEEE